MANLAFLVGANSKGLKYAKADLNRILECLKTLGFSIIVPDDHATATDVIKALRMQIAGLSYADQFLFYFVGHGLARSTTVQLALHTTNFNDNFSFLDSVDVISSLSAAECQSKLMILDCCESANINQQSFSHIRDFELITVAENWERSPEIPAFKAGAFAHFFTLALDFPQPGFSGDLTTGNIVDWIQHEIAQYNSQQQIQIPRIIMTSGHNIRQFCFAKLSELPMKFDAKLAVLLENVLADCRHHNVFPYSSFIYAALLADQNALLRKSLDLIEPFAAEKFLSLLRLVNDHIKSEKIGVKKFKDFNWSEQDFIRQAIDFKIRLQLKDLNEQTLCFGLLKSSSNTTLKLQQQLGGRFPLLLQFVEHFSDHKTPIF